MSLLLAIDASNLAHRAYFADPACHQSMYSSWIEKLHNLHSPDEVYIAVDSTSLFRRDIYPAYKDGRVGKSAELIGFLASLRESYPPPAGFEADDVIASAVKRHYGEAIVVSSDLDLCATVSGRVSLVRPPDWATRLGPEDVYAKLGCWPDQVAAYKALRGDPSDNIKGVAGIGEKKARKLLETYGTFEGVLSVLPPEQQEEARFAMSLVALRDDALEEAWTK